DVTILEGEKTILSAFEKSMTKVVSKKLEKNGAEVITEAFAKSVEESDEGVKVTYEVDGEEKTIEADYVLVTVGRSSNTKGIELDEQGLDKIDEQCRTSKENIYAIGDIVKGLPLAHKASYEGKVAAEVISGEKSVIDYLAMPAVVFSDPEMATVGYTEAQAKEEGIDINASKFPFGANGRALSLNDSEGSLKLITRKDDGLVIGGQIVGPNASEMIGEITLAIESGMTAED